MLKKVKKRRNLAKNDIFPNLMTSSKNVDIKTYTCQHIRMLEWEWKSNLNNRFSFMFFLKFSANKYSAIGNVRDKK